MGTYQDEFLLDATSIARFFNSYPGEYIPGDLFTFNAAQNEVILQVLVVIK